MTKHCQHNNPEQCDRGYCHRNNECAVIAASAPVIAKFSDNKLSAFDMRTLNITAGKAVLHKDCKFDETKEQS